MVIDTPPTHADAARRARVRTLMIANGFLGMAIAGFFLGWGHSVAGLEHQTAWLIAAVLAASGVISFFVATLAFGRKGRGRELDEGEDSVREKDEPVIRR
ncbi:MAG: hypothetical protein U1F37_13415 [Alphaproteobacteria bacterium]